MRNWNNSWSPFKFVSKGSFYITYEELKLAFPPCIGGGTALFTLPMRNWNLSKYLNLVMVSSLFTLPMRNWNMLGALLEALNFTSFLHYLWGIETLFPCEWWRTQAPFYITYEELKHLLMVSLSMGLLTFYITYEELKPKRNSISLGNVLAFYITYEELKQLKQELFPSRLRTFYITYEELKPI